MKANSKTKSIKPQSRGIGFRNISNFNETNHGELDKEPVFQNLKAKRKSLHSVRGNKPSSTHNQIQLLTKRVPYRDQEEELRARIEREVELEIKREELNTREDILKWLKNPKIRRLASEEFQRTGHMKRSNKIKYQIALKKRQLAKLKEIDKNFTDQLKTDPLLKSKLASLVTKNNGMKDMLFEESEYTKTLRYMINRQNVILQHKSKRFQDIKSEMRFLNIKILSMAAPEINENLYNQPENNRIIPDKKFLKPLKKELFTLKIFEKIKEKAKNIVDEEEKHKEDQMNLREKRDNLEKKQHMLKSMRDYKRLGYYMENYDNNFHRKANVDMLNDIIEKVGKNENNDECPYDPMQELTSENFFINKEEMDQDAQKIIETNEKVNKDTLVSNTGHISLGMKQFASREFVVMIKETFDEYTKKKEYLKNLKEKLAISEEKEK